MRQIILDTETTGMNIIGPPHEGHRIIEIGAVEVINRRLTGNNFHFYINPNRLVEPEAFRIHGISDDFLKDKPTFSQIADDFLAYIKGGELVIHNASFDIGFIDYEFSRLHRGIAKTDTFCKITDSLSIARKLFPGKRNNLNALCTRYKIDNSKRTLHGALLDAEILAEIFLMMTGGQITLPLFTQISCDSIINNKNNHQTSHASTKLCVIHATEDELTAHTERLNLIKEKNGICLWDPHPALKK
ncbi:DNA polymerase III subunit epsilon [Candidatus Erwinia haradaeae]|uniref:DNA polymerase III subunit epsilon n=1 Tax=Candidatus Erwinia haradaeae TaxID=1922217 RepID=A0A451DI75_9GAMM|nr:DNA polymerase III subunit epsilon [Candidatus Erwinia haradaeae]VFP86374.1 DNA polymerase III subunit epsilon [Candidatus Erwinia haradaeae]